MAWPHGTGDSLWAAHGMEWFSLVGWFSGPRRNDAPKRTRSRSIPKIVSGKPGFCYFRKDLDSDKGGTVVDYPVPGHCVAASN
jgi:hypothetical protein